MHRSLLVVAALALAGGCSSDPMRDIQKSVTDLYKKGERAVTGEPAPPQYRGEPALRAGLRQYADARYADSARSLQRALDLGLDKADQIDAHKHLAFMHCAGGRTAQCRNEFRRALRIDPNLELDAAESGHPTWGPVFRSAKAER